MTSENKTLVFDTPEQIAMVRLLSLRSALHLEMNGMTLSRGRRSASAILKSEFGWTGTKATIMRLLEEHIVASGFTPEHMYSTPKEVK